MSKIYLIILIVLAGFILFFHLGSRPLLSSGEARASEIALEMLKTGNIFVPRLNEEIILTKPPLFHWLIIICYRFFGINEFSSRIIPALAGVLVVLVVYLFGCRFWDKKTGFYAGLILLTSTLFFWSARCARIDSLLVFFITVSMYCFWRAYEIKPLGRKWFLGWFFFMGLGVLAKGPVGAVIPLLTVVLFSIFTGKKETTGKINWIYGLLVFLAVVLPWYIAICFKVPHEKAELFFLQQNRVWFSGGGEWYKGYVYIPHFFIGFFPWSVIFPVVVLLTWNNFTRKKDERSVFLWIWALVSFLIFFFFGKKVSRYILPMYPAAALLTAYTMVHKKNLSRIVSLVLIFVCLFLMLAVNVYTRFLNSELILIINTHINSLWITMLGFLLICLCLYGVKSGRIGAPIGAALVLLSMFVIYLTPVERDYYSPKPFCEMLKDEVSGDASLRSYNSWDNTIRYYYGRHVDIIRDESALREYVNSPGKRYCFMWKEIYDGLPDDIKKEIQVIKEGYKILEHKVVLVINISRVR